MCTVSAIYDYGQRMDPSTWTKENFYEFQKLIDAARRFDKVTNQPDCEDPNKRIFLEIVESKLNDDEDFSWYEGEVDEKVLRTIIDLQKKNNSQSNEQYPDCECGHPQHEHWYPENFPTSVICHVDNCKCENYVPRT